MLGWPEGEVKMTKKRGNFIFSPSFHLDIAPHGNLGDLGFWFIVCLIFHVVFSKNLVNNQ